MTGQSILSSVHKGHHTHAIIENSRFLLVCRKEGQLMLLHEMLEMYIGRISSRTPEKTRALQTPRLQVDQPPGVLLGTEAPFMLPNGIHSLCFPNKIIQNQCSVGLLSGVILLAKVLSIVTQVPETVLTFFSGRACRRLWPRRCCNCPGPSQKGQI